MVCVCACMCVQGMQGRACVCARIYCSEALLPPFTPGAAVSLAPVATKWRTAVSAATSNSTLTSSGGRWRHGCLACCLWGFSGGLLFGRRTAFIEVRGETPGCACVGGGGGGHACISLSVQIKSCCVSNSDRALTCVVRLCSRCNVRACDQA